MISGDDIVASLSKLGFDMYVAPAAEYLARYRSVQGEMKAQRIMDRRATHQQAARRGQPLADGGPEAGQGGGARV